MSTANVWSFPAEGGYQDTYEFLTEVLETYSAEQRIKLRKNPRRIVSMNSLLSQEQLVAAKKKARRYNQTQKLFVPLWSEHEVLSLSSSTNVIELPRDYQFYKYNSDDKVIIWSDWDDYIVRDISDLSGTDITLSSTVGSTVTNAIVMPLREARALNGFAFSEMSKGQAYVSVDFTLVDSGDAYGLLLYDLYSLDDLYDTDDLYTAPFDSHEGYYVRNIKPYRMQAIQDKILKPITIIDNGFGPIEVEAQVNYDKGTQSIELWSQSQSGRVDNRDFVTYLEGRILPFYLPTFNDDITILSGTYSGSTIDIDGSNAETEDFEGKRIMVEYNDGTQEYYTISSVSDVGSGTYRLDLGVTSVDITSGDVFRICFMNLVRSNTDSLSISHGSANASTIRFNVVEVPN